MVELHPAAPKRPVTRRRRTQAPEARQPPDSRALVRPPQCVLGRNQDFRASRQPLPNGRRPIPLPIPLAQGCHRKICCRGLPWQPAPAPAAHPLSAAVSGCLPTNGHQPGQPRRQPIPPAARIGRFRHLLQGLQPVLQPCAGSAALPSRPQAHRQLHHPPSRKRFSSARSMGGQGPAGLQHPPRNSQQEQVPRAACRSRQRPCSCAPPLAARASSRAARFTSFVSAAIARVSTDLHTVPQALLHQPESAAPPTPRPAMPSRRSTRATSSAIPGVCGRCALGLQLRRQSALQFPLEQRAAQQAKHKRKQQPGDDPWPDRARRAPGGRRPWLHSPVLQGCAQPACPARRNGCRKGYRPSSLPIVSAHH